MSLEETTRIVNEAGFLSVAAAVVVLICMTLMGFLLSQNRSYARRQDEQNQMLLTRILYGNGDTSDEPGLKHVHTELRTVGERLALVEETIKKLPCRRTDECPR